MTHNERVLALLADGDWHSHHELYALNVIAHSRVSELRRRGHVIELERDGDLYLYRLVSGETGTGGTVRTHGSGGLSADQPSDGEPGGRFGSPSPLVDTPYLVSGVSSPSEQLELEIAA